MGHVGQIDIIPLAETGEITIEKSPGETVSIQAQISNAGDSAASAELFYESTSGKTLIAHTNPIAPGATALLQTAGIAETYPVVANITIRTVETGAVLFRLVATILAKTGGQLGDAFVVGEPFDLVTSISVSGGTLRAKWQFWNGFDSDLTVQMGFSLLLSNSSSGFGGGQWVVPARSSMLLSGAGSLPVAGQGLERGTWNAGVSVRYQDARIFNEDFPGMPGFRRFTKSFRLIIT